METLTGEAPMVPENPYMPEHLSAMIEQLTPKTRPRELTDPVWRLIVRCYQTPRDYYFTYMDIYECLDKFECSRAPDRGENKIELPWVLFVRSKQWAWPVPQDVS
ncbi:hypothetical protein [Jidongwangia harbinensis]|uniref:hypothetical protein n=1 Tax=Jidongwangia harbinensis TaxID=2878561 RepID=UPI001CD9FD1F|nr:hypothetical protein [Jidongwangia harbinensis]